MDFSLSNLDIELVMSHGDTLYLANKIGGPLAECLADLTIARPPDPIEYIGKWLYRYADKEQYFADKARMCSDIARATSEMREIRRYHILKINDLQMQINIYQSRAQRVLPDMVGLFKHRMMMRHIRAASLGADILKLLYRGRKAKALEDSSQEASLEEGRRKKKGKRDHVGLSDTGSSEKAAVRRRHRRPLQDSSPSSGSPVNASSSSLNASRSLSDTARQYRQASARLRLRPRDSLFGHWDTITTMDPTFTMSSSEIATWQDVYSNEKQAPTAHDDGSVTPGGGMNIKPAMSRDEHEELKADRKVVFVSGQRTSGSEPATSLSMSSSSLLDDQALDDQALEDQASPVKTRLPTGKSQPQPRRHRVHGSSGRGGSQGAQESSSESSIFVSAKGVSGAAPESAGGVDGIDQAHPMKTWLPKGKRHPPGPRERRVVQDASGGRGVSQGKLESSSESSIFVSAKGVSGAAPDSAGGVDGIDQAHPMKTRLSKGRRPQGPRERRVQDSDARMVSHDSQESSSEGPVFVSPEDDDVFYEEFEGAELLVSECCWFLDSSDGQLVCVHPELGVLRAPSYVDFETDMLSIKADPELARESLYDPELYLTFESWTDMEDGDPDVGHADRP